MSGSESFEQTGFDTVASFDGATIQPSPAIRLTVAVLICAYHLTRQWLILWAVLYGLQTWFGMFQGDDVIWLAAIMVLAFKLADDTVAYMKTALKRKRR